MARYFTLEEATALLPRLTALLQSMQRAKDAFESEREAVAESVERASGNGHLQEKGVRAKRAKMEESLEELRKLEQELTSLGCELKGVDEGLVDFRAKREGRDVYLCWRLGEDAITHWHDLDTGFAGRQPL